MDVSKKGTCRCDGYTLAFCIAMRPPDYQRALLSIFTKAPEKHRAFEQARDVLLDMAADQALLRTILEQHLRVPENLNTLNFPSLAFEIARSPHFLLVANAFFPHGSGTCFHLSPIRSI